MMKYTITNEVASYTMVMEIAFNMTSEIFVVGGFDESDCLDNFADYCEEMEYLGAFCDEEEDEFEEYVTAGNHCHKMDLNQFVIQFK